MNKRKEIHIIGGGLYGCLLAYQLLKKKYKVSIFEKSDRLVNSFDSIKLNKISLNNGFHGIDLPRSRAIFNFFKKNLKLHFNIFLIKRKILFQDSLIDYTANKNEWPEKIQSYLKKDIKNYKNQKLNFFFKDKIINLFNINSLRYFDTFEKAKGFFLPWFLPADIKHISSDEGDRFRSSVRQKRIKGYVALPKNHVFEIIKKKMYKFLISKGASVYFNTEIKVIKNEIKYFNKDKEIFFEKRKIRKIFYCLSSAFLIKDVSISHFKKLNNYKRFAINCIIEVKDQSFNNNFSEILCLNKKISFINRIYSLNYYKYQNNKNNSYLVVEILRNKNFLSNQNKKVLISEIKKIFKLKIKPNIIDYKVTRQIYSVDNKWIDKSQKILREKIKKTLNLSYMNNFYPLNMNKAWINALKNSKLL